jgi:glutamate dehydrogenase (NADP+)
MKNMLEVKNDSLMWKKILISGSGNVAQYAAEKCLELWAKVLTMSDSSWYIYFEHWIDKEQLEHLKYLKNEKRVRISEFCKKHSEAKFYEKSRPWDNKADIALPCATQNEIEEIDAQNLIKNWIFAVWEWANMPSNSRSYKYICWK